MMVIAVSMAYTDSIPSNSNTDVTSVDGDEDDQKLSPLRLPAIYSKPESGSDSRIKKDDGFGVLSIPDT
jgi:hypothetical protein